MRREEGRGRGERREGGEERGGKGRGERREGGDEGKGEENGERRAKRKGRREEKMRQEGRGGG